MKQFIVLMVLLSYMFASEANIHKALKPWQPKSVLVSGEKLRIVLNEKQVTQKIYSSVFMAGLCLYEMAGKRTLENISEVEVLNQWEKQGYVLEKADTFCGDISDKKGKEPEMYLLGRTHLY